MIEYLKHEDHNSINGKGIPYLNIHEYTLRWYIYKWLYECNILPNLVGNEYRCDLDVTNKTIVVWLPTQVIKTKSYHMHSSFLAHKVDNEIFIDDSVQECEYRVDIKFYKKRDQYLRDLISKPVFCK